MDEDGHTERVSDPHSGHAQITNHQSGTMGTVMGALNDVSNYGYMAVRDSVDKMAPGDRAALSQEEDRLYVERRRAVVERGNASLEDYLSRLEDILPRTMRKHNRLDFDTLKQTGSIGIVRDPSPGNLLRQWTLAQNAQTAPPQASKIVKMTGMDRWEYKSAKFISTVLEVPTPLSDDVPEQYVRYFDDPPTLAQYMPLPLNWLTKKRAVFRDKYAADVELAHQDYTADNDIYCIKEYERTIQHGYIDRFQNEWIKGEPQAVVDCIGLILRYSTFPGHFPRKASGV